MRTTGKRWSASIPPPETKDEYWDWWIKDTVEIVRAGPRREGVDERTIDRELDEIVADIRDRQYRDDREPNPYTDFAPPPPERVVDAVPVLFSDVPIEDQPTQLLPQLEEQPTQPLSGGRGRRRMAIPLDLEP